MTNSFANNSATTSTPVSGDTMSNQIVPSQNFYGKFDAIINGERVPCANLATARHLIANANRPVIPAAVEPQYVTLSCTAFCSPTGQYYVVVPCGRVDVRVDCHNAHTARAWQRDGVSVASFQEAVKEDHRNVRTKGGWGAC